MNTEELKQEDLENSQSIIFHLGASITEVSPGYFQKKQVKIFGKVEDIKEEDEDEFDIGRSPAAEGGSRTQSQAKEPASESKLLGMNEPREAFAQPEEESKEFAASLRPTSLGGDRLDINGTFEALRVE